MTALPEFINKPMLINLIGDPGIVRNVQWYLTMMRGFALVSVTESVNNATQAMFYLSDFEMEDESSFKLERFQNRSPDDLISSVRTGMANHLGDLFMSEIACMRVKRLQTIGRDVVVIDSGRYHHSNKAFSECALGKYQTWMCTEEGQSRDNCNNLPVIQYSPTKEGDNEMFLAVEKQLMKV
jgi:hypothetical protein